MLWTSLTAIGALLLIVSGGAKIIDPEPTRGALDAMGVPFRWLPVAVLAVAEVVFGAVALGGTGGLLIPLTTLYAAFAGFVVLALARSLPIQSCGCFGRADTPPSMTHLVVNLIFALGGVLAIAVGADPPLSIVESDGFLGLAFAGLAFVGVWVAYLLLAVMPVTLAEARGSTR